MGWRTRGTSTGPAASNAGFWVRPFCVLTKQESCIFSTHKATALENPAVVKTSISIQRGDAVFFRYRVKPPSCFPLRFVRLKVKLQFVSDDVRSSSQKN